MTLVVAYNTTYGSTQQYAEEFARRNNVEAVQLDRAKPILVTDDTTSVVVFSPNYAGKIEGVDFLNEVGVKRRKAALAVVGMTLSAEVRGKDPAAAPLTENASLVQRFYLPGRLNYSELSRVHRATMWGMNKVLKAKRNPTENEQEMLRTYDTDTDRIDFSELEPIQAWWSEEV